MAVVWIQALMPLSGRRKQKPLVQEKSSLPAWTAAVSIPVIASGGAGTLEHFYEGLTDGGADAVLAASLFHYKELEISQVKDYLAEKGVPVRR